MSPFGLCLMAEQLCVCGSAPHLLHNAQQGKEWACNTHRKVCQQVPLLLPEPTGGSVSCFPRSTGAWRSLCRFECPWSRSSASQSSRCQAPTLPLLFILRPRGHGYPFWPFLHLALISWGQGLYQKHPVEFTRMLFFKLRFLDIFLESQISFVLYYTFFILLMGIHF